GMASHPFTTASPRAQIVRSLFSLTTVSFGRNGRAESAGDDDQRNLACARRVGNRRRSAGQAAEGVAHAIEALGEHGARAAEVQPREALAAGAEGHAVVERHPRLLEEERVRIVAGNSRPPEV